MDVTTLNRAAERVELALYSPEMMDFNGQIDKSFLPEINRLANENHIELVIVRTRGMNYATLTN
jgi:hypothetical protein